MEIKDVMDEIERIAGRELTLAEYKKMAIVVADYATYQFRKCLDLPNPERAE